MPINWKENGTIEGTLPLPVPPRNKTQLYESSFSFGDDGQRMHGTDLFLTSHLIFTYVFSLIALWMLHQTYGRFVQARQLFSLDHAHSIPARTVLVSRLPPHLRSERQLADYFESMGPNLHVESVNVVRHVEVLSELLEARTSKLRKLEEAWTKYVGNPSGRHPGYDREAEVGKILDEQGAKQDPEDTVVEGPIPSDGPLIDHSPPSADGSQDEEATLALPPPPKMFTIEGKARPRVRPGWFKSKVDALDFYAAAFREADDAVLQRRRGRFRPTELAFVTFESIGGAQIAAQASTLGLAVS